MHSNPFASQMVNPKTLMTSVLALVLVLFFAVAGPALAQDNGVEPPISGTITDGDTGEPIAEAQVTLLLGHPPNEPGPPSGAGQVVTDENGAYAFTQVADYPDRDYSLIVEAEGYQTGQSDPFIYDGSAPLQMDMALDAEAGDPVVTGVVVDADSGLPIPQATVWVMYGSDHGLPGQAVEADGTFSIWGIEPDRDFTVWAEADMLGYESASSETLLYDGENTIAGIEIALGQAPLTARGIERAAEFIDDFDSGLTDIGNLSLEAQQAINALAFYGITLGKADGTYQPFSPVTRSHMALFLARVVQYAVDTTELEAPATITDPGFTDTSALSQEAKDAIALLYTLGITQGTTPTTFSPYADVTRRDMASFMVRLQNVLEPDSYTTAETFFTDVPDTLSRAADINALAAQGISVGYGDGTFGPFDSVTRAQMALFIMRHIDENVEAGRLPALLTEDNIQGVWNLKEMDVGLGENRRTRQDAQFMMYIMDGYYSAIRDFTPDPEPGSEPDPTVTRSFAADAGTYEFTGTEMIVDHLISAFPVLGSMTFTCYMEDDDTLILEPQYDKMVMPGMEDILPSEEGEMGYGDMAVKYVFERLETPTEDNIQGVWNLKEMDVGLGENRRTRQDAQFMMYIMDGYYSAIRDFTPDPEPGSEPDPTVTRSFAADAGTYEFTGTEMIVDHLISAFPVLGSMTFTCYMEDDDTLILEPQYDKMVMPGMEDILPSEEGEMGYGDMAVKYVFERLN